MSRPLFWSLRREVWENRYLYITPLAVAGLALLGYSLSLVTLPHRLRTEPAADLAVKSHSVATQFSMVAVVIILTTYLVAAFYSLEALHGERRDRTILFWKSLPVSDRTTLLSKLAVPLALLPALVVALVVATQVLMLMVRTSILVVSGMGGYGVATRPPLLQMTVVLVYGMVVHALWHAPVYAWFLLVSAWARRTPFLWAVLPPLAAAALEKAVVGSSFLGRLIGDRLGGATERAFAVAADRKDIVIHVSQIDPARFLGTPGLWLGLAFAAAFVAAAIRLRRNREPL